MKKKLAELRDIAVSLSISIIGKRKQDLCNEILALQIPRSRSPIVVKSVRRSRSAGPPLSKDCEEWLANPGVNPKTGKVIKIGGPTYKKLEKDCTPPGSPKRSPIRARSPIRSPVRAKSPIRVQRTKGALNKLKKDDLVLLAIEMGLNPGRLLKPALVDLILNQQLSPQRPRSPSPPRSPSVRMVQYTKGALKKIKKADLIVIAEGLGIDTTGLLKPAIENLIFAYIPPSKRTIPSIVSSVRRSLSPRRGSPRRRTPSPIDQELHVSRSVRNISTLGDLEDLVASIPVESRISVPESLRRVSEREKEIEREIEREIILGSDFDLDLIPEERVQEIQELNALAHQNGFRMRNVPLDGNCMFSVIARAFNISSTEVRQRAVDYLRRCMGSFDHIPVEIMAPRAINWDDYIDKLEKNACWGDNTALFAAASALNFQARILQVAGGGSWLTVGTNEDRIVYMGYLDNFHYVSLVPFSGPLNILEVPKYRQDCPPVAEEDRRIPERIRQEADVIEQDMRGRRPPRKNNEKPENDLDIPRRKLVPSIPAVPVPSRPKLQPSIPGQRQPSFQEGVPLARLETLTRIKDIIDALQRPLEHKLSTLTNTEKAIMQCIGVA
jgi:hypothetical protein